MQLGTLDPIVIWGEVLSKLQLFAHIFGESRLGSNRQVTTQSKVHTMVTLLFRSGRSEYRRLAFTQTSG
jgi:hypothetical protein